LTVSRKSWIEHRLEELAEIFSVAVAGFAILDNHLHLPVRLDPHVAQGWSDEDVVRRWGRLFPPRDKWPRRWRGPGNNGSRRRAGAWDTGEKGRDETY